MTSPANDTSELTAYALGELHAHQAGEIHQLLAQCPAATTELEQIEAVTDALRQRAPILQERLHPEQRHAVLRPASIPRRIVPMQPRQPERKASTFWPVMGGLLKAAAVITISGIAYWAGRHTNLTPQDASFATLTESQTPEAPAKTTPIPEQELAAVVPSPAEIKPAVVAPAPIPALLVKAPEKSAVAVVSAASQPKIKVQPAPISRAPAPGAPTAVNRLNANVAFVTTSKQDKDQFSLLPAAIRPAQVKADSKDLFASPMTVKAPEAKADGKISTPDIYIHSWKAEITSCPWNTSTRLLRITIQLPADQPAALTTQAYPLKISFDRRHVREYRRLSECHVPAAELRSAGTQVVWYEFQPISDEVSAAGKSVGLVTLEKGHFTTQTVGPFDSSKLNVVDRGISWQSAREDFLFESAVVGFGMLLNGDHQSPSLNHKLVLALAEKGKGNDPNGERTRFIRQVNEARRAAGL